jgi:hypothetical protein
MRVDEGWTWEEINFRAVIDSFSISDFFIPC